jgi:hypothetical protein
MLRREGNLRHDGDPNYLQVMAKSFVSYAIFA